AGGGFDYHGDAWADGTRPRIFGQCGRICGPTWTVSRAGGPQSPVRSDCLGITDPDQNSAILIHGDALSVNQFFLEDIEVLVIQIEAHPQGAIGHPSLAFEEVDDLGEHFIEGHEVTFPLSGLFLSVSAKMTQNGSEGKRDTSTMRAGVTCHRPICGCPWSVFHNGRETEIRILG